MKRLFYKSAGKVWYHPSVIRLMQDAKPGESPEEEIILRAKARVAEMLQLGWAGPPFDPEVLAHLLGINLKEVHSIEAEAQIVPRGGQFELHFRRGVADKRLNFTLCHEIAHTLFPDCANMIHQRNTHRSTFDPQLEIEYLCDIGAAQILMPPPFFEKDLSDLGVSLKSVSELSDRYNASREAVIRRIPSASTSACAVVYLNLGYNKMERERLSSPPLPFSVDESARLRPKLRIRRVYPTRDFSIFLPPNKSIPDNSQVYDLLCGEEYVTSVEKWEISGFGTHQIEAVRLYSYSSSGNPGILVLIH